MSRWTHVIGSIQCGWQKDMATEFLGKPVLWDDHEDLEYGTPEYEDYFKNVWEKAFDDSDAGTGIPMGSEGSIDWHFIDVPSQEHTLGEGSMIAIEGDLRDFGGDKDIQTIINWFARVAKEARFATLTIKDEWSHEFITLTYYWGTMLETRYKDNEKENFE